MFHAGDGVQPFKVKAADAYGNIGYIDTLECTIVFDNELPMFGDVLEFSDTLTATAGDSFTLAIDASDTDDDFKRLEIGLLVDSVDTDYPDSTTFYTMRLAGDDYNDTNTYGFVKWSYGESGGGKNELNFVWETTQYDVGTYEIWFYEK